MQQYASPLLSTDTPLDDRSRRLIEELIRREYEKSLILPTDDPLDQKRRVRVGYTWDEMWAQPEMIRLSLSAENQAIQDAAAYFSSTDFDRLVMAGCGDSIAVMIAVRSFFESLLGIPCEPIQALDFAYYYNYPLNPRTLVIVLSSSGATTRVVEALMLAKAKGAPTLALTNTVDSPLWLEADQRILIHAERKGWPTQSSTAAMAILYQFALELARRLRRPSTGGHSAETDTLEQALHATPALIGETLQAHNEAMRLLAEELAERPLYLFAGGGPSFASALFGAAKVKECSPAHAIAIMLEEYHHYNSQKPGEPLFLVAPAGPGLPRLLDTAREGKRSRGYIYSLVSEGDRTLQESSDLLFTLPRMDERLSPMVYTIPLHLFAYHVAMAKFHLAERLLSEHG